MMKNTQNVKGNEGGMIVIVGSVSTMYITDGTVNLLKGMQGKMLATGMAAAVEGMAGSVANSAMLAMYDGESVQHFGCYIGEKMVIGTFENIGFGDGDEVQMIVTRLDEQAFFAHAVIRTKDALLWMPFSINKGRLGIASWIAKLLLGIGMAGIAFLLCLRFFMGGFESNFHLIRALGPYFLGVGGVIGYLTYRSSIDDGLYAETILKRIGFKSPWRINLSPYSQARLGTGASYQVYDLRKVFRAYGSLRKTAQAAP
jgi:hypothetical protein